MTDLPKPLLYLIIEDSPDVCDQIALRLRQYDHWQCGPFCHSVRTAIASIQELRPALLLLDWNLKGGSAYEVLDAVRSLGYRPYIIFFTGFQTEEPTIPERITNEYGVDKYLVKPIWERLSVILPECLAAAEARAFQHAQQGQTLLWLKDVKGISRQIDLNALVAIKQHPTEPRERDFYFYGKGAWYSFPLTWSDCTGLLDKAGLSYFVPKSRTSLVMRRYIRLYDPPFVVMNGLGIRFEVVREKQRQFEAWMKKDVGMGPLSA